MNSIPFLTRLIAATILARQNKALIAEVAYLRAEIAYLHEQIPKDKRLRFDDRWRKRLARAAAGIGLKRLKEIATVAKAATIKGWHRLMLKGKLGIKRAGPGRARTSKEIEQVVLRLAKENPTWGQMRIAGMLVLMLIPLSPRTIAAILDRHGIKPAPDRSTDWSWKRFVTEKADALVATDFFTVDVVGLLGTVTYDVLFAIHHVTRKVKILGVTEHSNEAYMAQVARNETMEGGWLKEMGCRYLIHDRDTKFCGRWQDVLNRAGIETVPIPPRSPNCNAIAERWVRTVKRECTRKLWFLSYGGLCQVLDQFVEHYNTERPHQGMGNKPLAQVIQGSLAPAQKSIAGFQASQIRCATRCNGTVRHYYRDAA
jgi:transposase InsO family protein